MCFPKKKNFRPISHLGTYFVMCVLCPLSIFSGDFSFPVYSSFSFSYRRSSLFFDFSSSFLHSMFPLCRCPVCHWIFIDWTDRNEFWVSFINWIFIFFFFPISASPSRSGCLIQSLESTLYTVSRIYTYIFVSMFIANSDAQNVFYYFDRYSILFAN